MVFGEKKKRFFEKTLVSFFPPLTSPLRVHRGRNFSQTILGYCIPRMDKYVAIKNQPLVELSLPPAGIGGAASWQLVPAVHHHLCQLSPVPPCQLSRPSWPASYPASPAARTRPLLTLMPTDPWTDGLRLLLDLNTSPTRFF